MKKQPQTLTGTGGIRPNILRIEASAGAGKTYQLTLRFLALLAGMDAVTAEALRSIIAVTFTNKAAAEMKERILRALKEIVFSSGSGPALSRQSGMNAAMAEAWIEIILHHYSSLQIRTIDSLVFALLKGVALELGLRPDIEAELREDVLVSRAFDNLLFSLAEGNCEVDSIFEATLRTFLEMEYKGGFNPERAIRTELGSLFREQPFDYQAAGSRFSFEDLEKARERLEERGKRFVDVVSRVGGKFRHPKWDGYFLDPVPNINATPFRKHAAADVLKKDPVVAAAIEPVFQDFREAFQLYLLVRALARMTPYTDLLRFMRREVDAIERQEGLVRAGGWLERVKAYLDRHGSAAHIYCKFGGRFKHFLIDEFQDTSRLQWEVLRPLIDNCLSEGGSLTFVGDLKQAIYVWRGGDPELMNEVSDDFPSARAETDHLPYNWRSDRAIIEFNNRIFGLLNQKEFARETARGFLYGSKATDAPPGCPYTEFLADKITATFAAVHQEPPPQTEKREGKVSVLRIDGKTNEERRRNIRKIIEREIPQRFYSGENVAVLVRKNTQAEEISGWLFELGIPTVTENALRLGSCRLVRELECLLRFLDYPSDDICFAGFMESGLLSNIIPEKQRHALLLNAGKAGKDSLYSAFCRAFPAVNQRYVKPFLDKTGLVGPYDIVQQALNTFDIMKRFPDDHAFLKRFLEVLAVHEGEKGAGLSGFLDMWDKSGSDERLGLPETLDAVRVLTIHAAKGLEFPVVFIPFPGWETRNGKYVRIEGHGLASTAKPRPDILNDVIMRDKSRDAVEALDLLYVALTRAKKELCLFMPAEFKGVKFGTGHILNKMLQEADPT